jgi:hypothetical protein
MINCMPQFILITAFAARLLSRKNKSFLVYPIRFTHLRALGGYSLNDTSQALMSSGVSAACGDAT